MIAPRRVSGLSAKHQRKLAKAIKQARHLALIPTTSKWGQEGGRKGYQGHNKSRRPRQ